jgi:hypothetical protein
VVSKQTKEFNDIVSHLQPSKQLLIGDHGRLAVLEQRLNYSFPSSI